MNPISNERARLERMLERIRLSRSPGELSRFGRQTEWMARSISSRKVTRFLHPHSEDYFSVLKPVFLHQLKSVDVLTNLAPVLARDGAVGLLDFFMRHPRPPSADTYLFVHYDLSWAVPEEWTGAVAYYRVAAEDDRASKALGNAGVVHLILSAINERHCGLADLTGAIEKLKSVFAGKPIRLCLTMLQARIFGKDDFESDVRSEMSFVMTKHVLETFGPGVEYAPWSAIQKAELGQRVFAELNPRRFYFADSFVTHHFLGKGCVLFGASLPEKDEVSLPLSFTHRYLLSVRGRSYEPKTLDAVRNEWRDHANDSLFRRDVRGFQAKDRFFGAARFCSPALEELAYALSTRIAGER